MSFKFNHFFLQKRRFLRRLKGWMPKSTKHANVCVNTSEDNSYARLIWWRPTPTKKACFSHKHDNSVSPRKKKRKIGRVCSRDLFWERGSWSFKNTLSKSLSLFLGDTRLVRVCVFLLPHYDSIQIWYLDLAVYCLIALHMTISHLWCVVLSSSQGVVFERDQNETFHFLFYSSWTLLNQ